MTTGIRKLKFEATLRPLGLRLYYQQERFSSLTIFALNAVPSYSQVVLMILGFYIVLGKAMPVKPRPLTAEERAQLEELKDGSED